MLKTVRKIYDAEFDSKVNSGFAVAQDAAWRAAINYVLEEAARTIDAADRNDQDEADIVRALKSVNEERKTNPRQPSIPDGD